MTGRHRHADFLRRGLLHIVLRVAVLLSATTASAADLPSYYPAEGFRRTAVIDAFIADEQRIVLNDISYTLADNVIVHTTTAYSVPKTALSVGDRIAIRLGGGDRIVEIWTLPADYADRRQR